MKTNSNSYVEYLNAEIQLFKNQGTERRSRLHRALDGKHFETVLDIGCGAGQEMLAFAEDENALCVGVDINPDAGLVIKQVFSNGESKSKVAFACARGEDLPFKDGSFDIVICRVTLPLMNNRKAISEISRVTRSGGVFFLKTHAPAFYFWMLRKRFRTLNAKQLAYPIICFTGGVWHWLTGIQLESGIWKGKEVFQTKGYLHRELARGNMRIVKELPDSSVESGSFMIVKE